MANLAKAQLDVYRKEALLSHQRRVHALEVQHEEDRAKMKQRAQRAIATAKGAAVISGGGRFVGLIGGALLHKKKPESEKWVGPVSFAASVVAYTAAMFAKEKDVPFFLGAAGVLDGVSSRFLIAQIDAALNK